MYSLFDNILLADIPDPLRAKNKIIKDLQSQVDRLLKS